MDRRELLGAGLMLGAGAMTLGGEALGAGQAPVSDDFGVGVGQFGAHSDAQADQTAALQKAIDEAGARKCVTFPAGDYGARGVKLKAGQTLLGAPGVSVLLAKGDGPLIAAGTDFDSFRGENDKIRICGLTFSGAQGAKNGLVLVKGGLYVFQNCRFTGCTGAGLIIQDADSVEIVNCTFHDCQGGALRIENAAGRGQAAMVSQNRFENCGAAIDGPAVVTNNIVSGAPKVGLMLGGKRATGQIMAAHNFVSGSPVGLGVAAEGDGYYMLALNLVTGAKDGAIRAFDKGKPIGPDLARASAEAFRHLGMFGNVAQ